MRTILSLAIALVAVVACSGREDPAGELDGSIRVRDASGLDAEATAPDASDDAAVDQDASVMVDARPNLDASGDSGALWIDTGIPGACPGSLPSAYPPLAKRCRSSSDCNGSETCGPRYEDPGCGACRPPQHECQDGGCASGSVCVERMLPCSCSPEPSQTCVARCTSTSCAADETCGSNGRCAPRSCKQGYACQTTHLCAPERMFADAHGCAVAHCDADAFRCPDGFRCEPTLSAPASNGCVAIHCSAGFTCAPNRTCSPTSSMPHGCEPKRCTRDDDCGCGVCIANTCQDELLVCSPPPAP